MRSTPTKAPDPTMTLLALRCYSLWLMSLDEWVRAKNRSRDRAGPTRRDSFLAESRSGNKGSKRKDLFYGPIIERVLYQNDLKLLITNELIDLE
jgi:hypothetical protein